MKVVFLDRDGVISEFTPGDYVKTWQEFKFIPQAIEALYEISQAGYKIVIVSNQAGVHKKLFSEEDLNGITKKMLNVFQNEGISIEKIYYCLHTDEENCSCRKPKPGLLFKAEEELGPIDFGQTFFVGDSPTDIEAGKQAGTKTILVLSGRTKSERETKTWNTKPDFVAKNLKHAVNVILGVA